MPLYKYRGIDKSGKEVKNTINVENETIAKQRLKAQGVMIISINLQKAKQRSAGDVGLGLKGRVSIEDLSLMTRQLATLIKARIQIVEALSALEEQVENDTLRVVLSEVKQKVNEGLSLAKALADYPHIFNSVYVNMVEAGEASGTLHIVLIRLAEFTEQQMKLKSKILNAMLYPVIIGTMGFIMMNIIFIFVIPKITKIFVSMKKEIPLQTRICMWISDVLQDYWWMLGLGMFGSYYLFKKYINSVSGKRKWHRFLLRMPLLKKLFLMIDISRFCSTLATLLNSGVPILLAMKIVKNLITNLWIQDAVEMSKEHVSEGKSIAPPLVQSGHFPPMVTHMISLGEKSGELEPMLQIVAENYADQIDSQLGKITATLNPIMMIILGGAVFFIVMSVIMPIMKLNSVR